MGMESCYCKRMAIEYICILLLFFVQLEKNEKLLTIFYSYTATSSTNVCDAVLHNFSSYSTFYMLFLLLIFVTVLFVHDIP